MNKKPRQQVESEWDYEEKARNHPDPYIGSVLLGRHTAQRATPEEAGAAAKAMLAAMRRAKRPVRPRRPRVIPTAKLNRSLPARPLTTPEKAALRQKFWAPGGYDPATAAEVVDKLLA